MLERIHLTIVQQVEQQGSLTAAAGVLNLTQSALSHSMKKLEQQLGTDIWLREGRSLRLTQAGQYLLAVANRVLPQLDLAEERLGQFAQGERGALRIGMECHPCYQWLLKLVAPYLATWPDVDVDVKQKFQFGGIGALFGYEIDLLVTAVPSRDPSCTSFSRHPATATKASPPLNPIASTFRNWRALRAPSPFLHTISRH